MLGKLIIAGAVGALVGAAVVAAAAPELNTKGGRYKPLADEDVQRIHNAALTVLENTGVEVLESECRQIFEKAGAKVCLKVLDGAAHGGAVFYEPAQMELLKEFLRARQRDASAP